MSSDDSDMSSSDAESFLTISDIDIHDPHNYCHSGRRLMGRERQSNHEEYEHHDPWIGCLVWARKTKYCWWPGLIWHPQYKMKKKPNNNFKCVSFFGKGSDSEYAWVNIKNLKPYWDHKAEYSEQRKTRRFEAACDAIETYIKNKKNERVSAQHLAESSLLQIFSRLPFKDLLNASSVCQHWRRAFYESSLSYIHIRIQPEMNDTIDVERLEYLREFVLLRVRDVYLSFDTCDEQCFEMVTEFIRKLQYSEQLKNLIINPLHCELFYNLPLEDMSHQWPLSGQLENDIKRLLRRVKNLEGFDYGHKTFRHWHKLIYYLSQNSPKLKRLKIASILEPAELPQHKVINILKDFKLLTNLQVLSLDYTTNTHELLNALHNMSLLEILELCVHDDIDIVHDVVFWEELKKNCPKLQLKLTVVECSLVTQEIYTKLFNPSMPLTHLKVLFCELGSVQTLNALQSYKDTLRSLIWVDRHGSTNPYCLINGTLNLNSIEVATVPENCQEANQLHPLVKLALICRKLSEIVIMGYFLDPSDVCSIAKFRGPGLKRFRLIKGDICTDRPWSKITLNNVEEVVSLWLKRKWKALTNDDLPKHHMTFAKRCLLER
ncbi:F-box only protein 33-like [Adelges cooleyi]|uniref:F-box only protein 33-like n=1 Tax=Adelges cooleyi TaxID=133065 RepID=UPI0021806E43|nr:F-box only protein 33-like [Adelges cooleyi]